MILYTFLSVVFLFGAIIIFHEFGHFIFAKIVGIEVYEFSFGFGPEIFRYETLETVYKICLFPIGGYVNLAGMEESDAEVESGFRKKPVVSKLVVILAGSGMNIILAILVLFSIRFFWGEPYTIPIPLINAISQNSPAQHAGFLPGDVILGINNTETKNALQVSTIIRASADKEIVIKIMRGYKIIYKKVIPKFDSKNSGGKIGIEIGEKPVYSNIIGFIKPGHITNLKIGDKIEEIEGRKIINGGDIELVLQQLRINKSKIKMIVRRGSKLFSVFIVLKDEEVGFGLKPLYKRMNFTSSFISGVEETGRILKIYCVGLYYLIVGKIPRGEVAGPVGIIKLTANMAKVGFDGVLFLTAFLSINLAIINMIPFPALDGSRFILILWEGVIRRPLNPKKENLFHLVGFIVLILLLIVLTYKDIYFPASILK